MTAAHTEPVISSDGTRLFVVEEGDGDTVLFIPGLGYGTWSWHHQVGPISDVARVLLMDNRGVGRSDRPLGPYSIEQMAEDAFHVLTQRASAPAHVVGASMGGYIAMTLARRHPETVKSLVLMATTSGGKGAVPVPKDTLAAWASAIPLGASGFARATMPLSFAPGWIESNPKEFEELLELRLKVSTPTESWRAQFEACAAYFRRGLPPGPIPHHAVILHGTADRVGPYENAAHLARRLPQAPLITLYGVGHLCWVEQAPLVNDVIRDVLASRSIRNHA